MSSSIHYRFRSMNELKIVTFNGNSISVPELIALIQTAEKINSDLFDLKLLKPSNVEYELTDAVPKNSIVIIQRAPAQNGKKAPKTSNAEFATGRNDISAKGVAHISAADFSKMSETERIQHAMRQSTYKYDPSSYRRPTKKANKEAPESFQCQRCYQFGHFPNNCPLANVRKTTGIPDSELIETTADDADRMLHNNGKWYITRMIKRAREQKKEREEQRRRGVKPQTLPSPVEEAVDTPADLKCPICEKLFKEAVTLPCGDSFCADCIFKKLTNAAFDDERCLCPTCQSPVTVNDMNPNESLRKLVTAFQKDPRSWSPSSASATTSIASSPTYDTPETTPSTSITPPPPVEKKEPLRLPTVNLCHVSSPSYDTPETAPSTCITPPPPVKKEEPLRLPTVNLCHLFQPKPVVKPPPPVTPAQETTCPSPSESTDDKPMKLQYDKRDMGNISLAWSLVPTFDKEIDLFDLVYGDSLQQPKLVYETDDKENCRESRKRHHTTDRRESKKFKNSHYY